MNDSLKQIALIAEGTGRATIAEVGGKGYSLIRLAEADLPVPHGAVLTTPLFVNAGAIALEVGGVLQHGAVIAREYGKPCVAGVDRVVSRLRDGQPVEVDGTAGVIGWLRS
jgi:phosphoenolpyruvate synthase/pyruvate phosphate dikinase